MVNHIHDIQSLLETQKVIIVYYCKECKQIIMDEISDLNALSKILEETKSDVKS